jgi:hypothetical protein
MCMTGAPGFTVKTRQQPIEPPSATRTSVTPAFSASGFDGSNCLLVADVADELQAASETDITTEDNADRKVPFTQMILDLA